MIAPGAIDVQVGGKLRSQFLEDLLPYEGRMGTRAERLGHLVENGERIQDLPVPRCVVENAELERQPVAVGVDVSVHSAGVSSQIATLLGTKRGQTLFRLDTNSENSLLPIAVNPDFPHDLGEFARRGASHEIHLEQSILCGDVALRKKNI